MQLKALAAALPVDTVRAGQGWLLLFAPGLTADSYRPVADLQILNSTPQNSHSTNEFSGRKDRSAGMMGSLRSRAVARDGADGGELSGNVATTTTYFHHLECFSTYAATTRLRDL